MGRGESSGVTKSFDIPVEVGILDAFVIIDRSRSTRLQFSCSILQSRRRCPDVMCRCCRAPRVLRFLNGPEASSEIQKESRTGGDGLSQHHVTASKLPRHEMFGNVVCESHLSLHVAASQ